MVENLHSLHSPGNKAGLQTGVGHTAGDDPGITHLPVWSTFNPNFTRETFSLPQLIERQPQPPAIAPITRRGSAPVETSSGSGASGGS
jgi:hypothetical protein